MTRMDNPQDEWDEFLFEELEDSDTEIVFDPDFLFELEMFQHDEEPDEGA